jgi:hypothetical protein
MARIRIAGMVRLANTVRTALSQPLASGRAGELERQVSEALATVRHLLATNGLHIHDLPGPSRRAYQYLASLDFAALPAREPEASVPSPARNLRLPGLHAWFDRLLNELAEPPDPGRMPAAHAMLCHTLVELNDRLQARDIPPEHLTPAARDVWVWLTYFQDRDRLDAYVAAVRAARRQLESVARAAGRTVPSTRVHFRAGQSLYRFTHRGTAARLRLPTQMVAFTDADFALLAAFVLQRADHQQALLERLTTGSCLEVQRTMEALAGSVSEGGGIYHDLAEAFARVNATYFDGQMPPPRFLWSNQVTGGRFGSYEFVGDTLTVSCTLDAPNVPACAVDFVVYHELLHKKHGIHWQSGRQYVHTPEFRRDERRFEQFEAAEAALNALARRHA